MKSMTNNQTDRQTDRQIRLDWIDIAKGIGIISMLIGHAFIKTQPFIYAFHMPLFFILAGYTTKKTERNDVLKVTIKDFKRLIIPCIIARTIILLGNCILKDESFMHELQQMIISLAWGNHNGSFFGKYYPSIGRIWFLPALFWTKLCHRILALHFSEKSRLGILLPLSFLSMLMGMHGIILPQNLDMIFICMLFVEIGILLKDIDLGAIKWWIAIVLFTVWTYFSCTQDIWISMNARVYPGYGLCIVVAVAANMCVFLFSHSLQGANIAKPFIFYGKHSLILLLIETISPHFYSAHTVLLKIIYMIVELLLVMIYVMIKNSILKIIRRRMA